MIFLLHHLLEASAASRPDAVAVRDRGRCLSYCDLELASSRLANLLVAAGVRPRDRVGLYLDKSAEAIIGLYGILKAGAGYVPLDPQAPPSRLAYIMRNCGITCLISSSEKAASWSALEAAGAQVETIVVMNEHLFAQEEVASGRTILDLESLESHSSTPPAINIIDADLAYILYTSGSTGEPKGVMLSHLNAMSFVGWAVARFELKPEDRLSSHAPLHFDLSILDVFAAAAAGSSVTLVPGPASWFPGEVVRFIDSNSITVWYSVPSVLTMVALRGGLRPGGLPSLRAMLFAGEVFPVKNLRRMMELLPHVRFHNLYGPTETNVCTHYEVEHPPEEGSSPIPIGTAIPNVEVFALTAEAREADIGEVGELHVRGNTVTRGYWGDSERTAKALVPNPLGHDMNDRVYRTGDLVVQNSGGTYSFLGRRDTQIKTRGYRVEPGDIEAALQAHPDVAEAVVVPVPDELVGNQIKAFVVASNAGLSTADLAAFCADRLPRYMVPASFELRDALPKTSTGKVDRASLCSSVNSGTPSP